MIKKHDKNAVWIGNDGRLWHYSPDMHRLQIYWSKEMNRRLAELYPTVSNRTIAEEFGMDRKTIEHHAQVLGLVKDKVAINARRSELFKKRRKLFKSKGNAKALIKYLKNETPEQKQIRIEKTKATKANFSDYQKAMYSYRHKLIWTPERLEKMKEKLRARYAEIKQKSQCLT